MSSAASVWSACWQRSAANGGDDAADSPRFDDSDGQQRDATGFDESPPAQMSIVELSHSSSTASTGQADDEVHAPAAVAAAHVSD